MEEVFKRVKELKVKALDIIEEKMNNKISCDELSDLTKCLNYIEEDKNFYNAKLIELLDTTNNKSLASGFNGGFGSVTNNETKSE
jgi:hypothetical protein